MKTLYIRGDYSVCPQPLSLDTYGRCENSCRLCFIKSMEQTLLKNKVADGDQPCDAGELNYKLNSIMNKRSNDATARFVRDGQPCIIGRKCEPMGSLEKQYHATKKCLKVLKDWNVPGIPETKGWVTSDYYDLLSGVCYSITPGDEVLYGLMDPKLPGYRERLSMAKSAVASGLPVFIKAEPIVPHFYGYDVLEQFIRDVADTQAHSVNFSAYRVHNMPIDYKLFRDAKTGYNFKDIVLSLNKWNDYCTKLFEFCKTYGVRGVSPDWVQNNSIESCCGFDGIFKSHHFTMQYAAKLLRERGQVDWKDMSAVSLFDGVDYEKFREIWNGKKTHFNPKDIEGVHSIGMDENLDIIYGKKSLMTLFG